MEREDWASAAPLRMVKYNAHIGMVYSEDLRFPEELAMLYTAIE